MNRSVKLASMACGLWAAGALAGGNPEHVQFPDGYSESFTHYATMNRAGKEQIAKMYANDVAIASYKQSEPAASGSTLVMEIYKPKKGDDGKAVVGSDGTYEIDTLAAVAVMRRSDAWDASLLEADSLAGWGFALFKPDGTPKDNTLTCVACHTPLQQQDYLFSYQQLTDYVKSD